MLTSTETEIEHVTSGSGKLPGVVTSHNNRQSVFNTLHFTSSLESPTYTKSTTLYAVHMHPKAVAQALPTMFNISLA